MSLPATQDEPLLLADGTKINPTTGEVIKDKKKSNFYEVPSPSAAQALIVKARKSVADLPAPPSQLSGVALVAFYTLFGLSDHDISLAVDGRLTVEQIERIRELDAYKEFMEAAKTNIIETNADAVREYMHNHAINAAHTIIQCAAGEEDNVLAFKASQDILDRTGNRPVDIVEHRHRMEDALHIVVTKRDESQQVPVIDLIPEKVVTDENL